jgi:hypothetical protein
MVCNGSGVALVIQTKTPCKGAITNTCVSRKDATRSTSCCTLFLQSYGNSNQLNEIHKNCNVFLSDVHAFNFFCFHGPIFILPSHFKNMLDICHVCDSCIKI